MSDEGVPSEGHGYRKGPVLLRGHQIPEETTDQRLLEPGKIADWVHSDPWRVMRIQSEFVEGFGALAEIGPAVSVFGSARTASTHSDYGQAEQIGRLLVEAGYAVITGGGPGLMEAANKGASAAGGTSIGLGIELPYEQGVNEHVNLGINFRYFFIRKTMFVKYAQGFIVMPGGFGTFDELFEAITLVQTHKVTGFPLVLFGTDYWGGLLDWIRTAVLDRGMIAAADLDLLYVTDDPHDAVNHVMKRGAALADERRVRDEGSATVADAE